MQPKLMRLIKAYCTPTKMKIIVSDLAYENNTVLLSGNYRQMQGLFEADNNHAASFGRCIDASKTNVVERMW